MSGLLRKDRQVYGGPRQHSQELMFAVLVHRGQCAGFQCISPLTFDSQSHSTKYTLKPSVPRPAQDTHLPVCLTRSAPQPNSLRENREETWIRKGRSRTPNRAHPNYATLCVQSPTVAATFPWPARSGPHPLPSSASCSRLQCPWVQLHQGGD